jgi:hypothetical protein
LGERNLSSNKALISHYLKFSNMDGRPPGIAWISALVMMAVTLRGAIPFDVLRVEAREDASSWESHARPFWTNRVYATQLAVLLERGDFDALSVLKRKRLQWIAAPLTLYLVATLLFPREIPAFFRPEFVGISS